MAGVVVDQDGKILLFFRLFAFLMQGLHDQGDDADVLLLVSFFLSVSLSLFTSFSFVMSTKVGEDGQGVVGFSTTLK